MATDENKKQTLVQVRLKEDHYDTIKEAARDTGLTMAGYMRVKALEAARK